jgi:hypothetical protein
MNKPINVCICQRKGTRYFYAAKIHTTIKPSLIGGSGEAFLLAKQKPSEHFLPNRGPPARIQGIFTDKPGVSWIHP